MPAQNDCDDRLISSFLVQVYDMCPSRVRGYRLCCASIWSRLVVKMAEMAVMELVLAAVDGGGSS